MVVKVYVSGISGNKEVKKRQQRVLMILDSKSIKYDVIDITEPGKESDKEFMQNNSKSNGGTVSDPNPRSALPPQVFNDDEYCGDYDLFDLANEVDTLEQFLKMEAPPEEPPQVDNEQEKAVNGDVEAESKETEASTEEKVADTTETADDKEKSPEKEGSPAKEASPTRDASAAVSKEGTPLKDSASKEVSPAKEAASKEGTPAKEAASKEGTPAKEAASKEGTPAKEAASKEGTPAKEAASKEGTPAKDENEGADGDSKAKSPEKEAERQKSVEKEGTPEGKAQSPEKETEVEAKQASKENSPLQDEVNENGTISSHEHSAEKTTAGEPTETAEVKKDNPSEALIQSEQVAAAE